MLVRIRMRPAKARLMAGLVAFCALALLALAAWLKPPTAGYGAHEQLGMLPCGMMATFGIPCPTCGMTTAFAHFSQGDFLASIHTQPAGFILALVVAATAMIAGYGLIVGRIWTINWYRVRPAWPVIVLALLLLTSWGYKILTTLAAGA